MRRSEIATINGIPMHQARLRGELTNATDYTHAEMVVWVLQDSDNGGWLDRARPVTIALTLRQGYGSESHLFDRTAARIAEAVEGNLFASAVDARKAVRAVRVKESLGFSVEVTPGNYHVEVPADLEAAAEAIRDSVAAKEAAKALEKRAKYATTLAVFHGEDGRWRVTTADAHGGARWVNSISGRYWDCHGLDSRSDADYVGIGSPNCGYASEVEADAVLAALRAIYGI